LKHLENNQRVKDFIKAAVKTVQTRHFYGKFVLNMNEYAYLSDGGLGLSNERYSRSSTVQRFHALKN